jgi:hypothetical protein
MEITTYPQVNEILDILIIRLKNILGEKLVGLYLDGSLVWGDFDPNISDIDLLAAVSSDINDQEFAALKEMHESLVSEHKEWDDRIEVCYISTDALKKVKSEIHPVVNISPGEPIHYRRSNKEWLINWYITREKGKTLFGPNPKTLIEPISKREFIQCVKNHAKSWSNWITTMPKNAFAQSYARLSMCRALYAYKLGDQVSKKQAALWAINTYPQFSEVVHEALLWRNGPKHSPQNENAYLKTVQFIKEIQKIIFD